MRFGKNEFYADYNNMGMVVMDFITVSPHPTGKKKIPRKALLEYDVVINVSDQIDFQLEAWFCDNRMMTYWLPMGEAYGIPLENIFAAMYLLWNAEQSNKKVLLHCVAGRNRSQMVFDCYHFMKGGKLENDSSMMLNINDNQLPGIYRMEVFLQKCLEVFMNPEVTEGALIDWIKKETFGF